MNKALAIWQLIKNSLEQNLPIMLLYVLESKGSSPGRQGFLMAVNVRGEMEGSVGGGVMEHKFVELTKEKLQSKVAAFAVRKQIHDKSAAKNQSGMICSGEQTILLYPVKPEDIVPIQRIITSLEQNKNGILQFTPAGLTFSEEDSLEEDFAFSFQSEHDWYYQERIGYKNHLFIIGGGHCALAFSRIMSMMDFYIHLYEDRPHLNTFLQNDYVHEKTIIESYGDLEKLIPGGENHYVVIMTFGYRTDDVALRALVNKQFAYFGLLGSKKKIEKMFADYKKEGMQPELLQNIHAPVGFQIYSQTPEEIAISIAAQIIEVKNKKKSDESSVQKETKISLHL
ncbi:MAG: XdhC family protein [Flavisolibacter sp.]|nr:XdhC family protein [Flavisolibacter sp.]